MWEAIESNRRRSWLLIGTMGAVLVVLGSLVGLALNPDMGPVPGALGALVLWVVLVLVAFAQGERAIMTAAGARQIRKRDAPQLYNVVEEMAIASGLRKVPNVYVIEDEAPNAFAAGLKPDHAVVAVTSGLLARLNRDELQGVIAHEVAHINNHDVRFMTIASVMLGSIVLISKMYLRYLFYGGGRRRTSSRPGGGHVGFVIVAAIAAFLAPVAARLLYFAVSRRREYLADASAARYTRYPDGLASALEKIAARPAVREDVNQALAPMYIVNPLQLRQAAIGFFSTHPPTDERIKILRSMGGRAGYVDYEAAYRKIHGRKSRCVGMRTLSSREAASIAARGPSVEPDTKADAVGRVQQVTDLLSRIAELLILTCACGVKIKIPDEYKKPTIGCPRCGRVNELPRAQARPDGDADSATAATPGEDAAPEASGDARRESRPAGDDGETESEETGEKEAATASLRFVRKGKGWESFRCSCDRVVQIAPGFKGHSTRCRGCDRVIEIVTAEQEVAV